MLLMAIGIISVGQSDWLGGPATTCPVDDMTCINNNCPVMDNAFDTTFCASDNSLVYYSPGKLRIYGTFQYLQEHTIKGPGEAGGWDNDPDIFDVNLDGHLDLVVTDESFPSLQDSVWVFLNDGNGNFTQITVDYNLGSVDEIHENDADGDGDVDLFTVGNASGNQDVVLFINTGAGWSKCVICTDLNGVCGDTGSGTGEAEGIYTGDLDGDGDVDIAVSHLNDGALYVFERVPMGTPGATGCSIPGAGDHYYLKHFVDTPSIGGGWNVIIADGDNDGDNDIFMTYHDGLVFYRNDGAMNFSRQMIENLPNKGYYGLAVKDLDRDGDVDIAVSNRNSDSVKIFTNDGAGNFSLLQRIYVPYPMGVVINDVEEDGDQDVFVASYMGGASSHTIYILVNDGGTFTPVSQKGYITDRNYFGVGSGDLDGDGDADLLVRAGRPGETPSRREGLYWYDAVLFYEDSAKLVSSIVDINGPSDTRSFRWDSLIVRGKNLEYLNLMVRTGRNLNQLKSNPWNLITNIANCTTFGAPVDSIKCYITTADSMVEFIQYRLDLYSHDGDGDGFNEISAIIYDVIFKFDETVTPVARDESPAGQFLLPDGMARIYSISGKLVDKRRIIGGKLRREGLPPGIYIIRIKTNDGRSLMRKMVITP